MRTVILGKWGNTLAVRIPDFVVQQMKLHAGDILELGFKDNYIIIKASKNSNQQIDEWLELFNQGKASLEDMPGFTS